jgi:signal transduction histidine kinase
MRTWLVQEIQKTAEQGTALTSQLLAYSRRPQAVRVATDVNRVICGLEKILRRLLGKRIDVVLAPAACPTRVMADPAQLEQVLMNLVLNARDAMPQGGQLRIETELATAASSEESGDIILTVSDTGCGMDADTSARVFEPYFTTKVQGQGTGLGLAIVRDIITGYGGRITVSSTPGLGTTFRICLPGAEVHAKCAAVERSAKAS